MRARLSPRLRSVAEMIPRGAAFADIAADHAQLAAWLVQRGRVPRAIASDLRAGPLAAARETLERHGLGDAIELRRGDGLAVLTPGEVATIVIAGVGGPLVHAMIERSPGITRKLERLIIQPTTLWPQTRRWIAAGGWTLRDERLVADGRQFYLSLALEPTAMPSPTRWTPPDLEFGPLLRRRRGPTYTAWLQHACVRLRQAVRRAELGSEARICPPALARRLAMFEAELDGGTDGPSLPRPSTQGYAGCDPIRTTRPSRMPQRG